MATHKLILDCECGQFQATVHPIANNLGNRGVCYCDDCQRYAEALGRTHNMLDAAGGTKIFQTTPGKVRITQGRDKLACLQLTTTGIRRWHTDCCQSPIGNTGPKPSPCFVGLIETNLKLDDSNVSLDDVLGPPRFRVMPEFAKQPVPPLGPLQKLGLGARFVHMVVAAQARGEQQRNPFFHPETGEPSVIARVLET